VSTSIRTRLGALAGIPLILMLPATSAQADNRCIAVKGSYVEHPVTGAECDSPVGLCVAAVYSGGVSGEAQSSATAIISTADTPTTSVQMFTSNSTITAKVKNVSGTLHIKNAGAFASTGDGSIVDLQTIVGGDGGLAGASGTLRAQGTFTVPDGGRSEYDGTVCLAG
jgi:hypothetical protein